VLTRASISFGLIPEEHWLQPDWIDEQRASDVRQRMMAKGVMYGGELPLHLRKYIVTPSL
jgi:alpha 1,2-mannosyltransferase